MPKKAPSMIMLTSIAFLIAWRTRISYAAFAAANDENIVSFTMPTTTTITKGVVLLFSTPGTVQNLYPSTDPQVTNDSVSC